MLELFTTDLLVDSESKVFSVYFKIMLSF